MGDDDNVLSINDLELNLPELENTSDAVTITLGDTTFSDSVYTTDTGSEYTFNVYGEEKEFEQTMPSVHKINNMCKHYPALAKAYENFKTIYKMVDQDYKGNHEEADNEIPF